MIEINISELFLWVWCIVATGFAMYYRHHMVARHIIIMTLLNDEEIRGKLITNIKGWSKEND